MLALGIVCLIAFAVGWAFVSILIYVAFSGTLIFSYLFIWDEHMRKATCPNGLLSAIFLNQ